MGEIAFLPAVELAAMVQRREIGCVELLEHFLARVDRFNPALNAIIVTDIPKARARAAAADDALARGEVWGPLHGVPMTVKDSFDVAGLPTTWGVPELKDNIAQSNALAVDRWLGAGAVVFGKTNVPIWLADAQSFNAIYGTTNNPWNLDLTPGGSSGGAAAALATGMTGIEMGSDIAGSIRNPAAFCGVYGHKPSYGICPARGHAPGDYMRALDILDIGPLARDVADLELGLSVISGPDEIAARGSRLELPPSRKKSLSEFKVGIMVDHPISPVEEGLRRELQNLADFLASRNTAISDTARPDIDIGEASRIFDILLRAATSGALDDDRQAAFRREFDMLAPDDDSKRARMLRGNILSHRDWMRFDEARQRMRWKWHEFFGDYDLLLCPVISTAAFAHDHTPPYDREVSVNGRRVSFNSLLFWAGFSCVSYLPATAAPIGFASEGRPASVQIVGPQYGDYECLRFASLLAQEYHGFVAPPGYD